MTELCRLSYLYGSDKAIGGYTPFYHMLFEDRRKDFLKVMEIGIGDPAVMTHVPGYQPGASLRMWWDYFRKATIYGLDINPNTLVQYDRIQSKQCDQRSKASLHDAAVWAGGDFDLIIDDGDHTAQSQLTAVSELLPLVRPGGFYIIEDAEDTALLKRELNVPHAIVEAHNSSVGKLFLIRK